MEDNEHSLFSLMKDRRINPMKVLPKLNRYHGWNMPGAKGEQNQQKVLAVNELPRIGVDGKIEGLPEKE